MEKTGANHQDKHHNHRAKPTPRLHRQTLIEMNIPVFTARRNAAHERVIDVLRREMLTRDKTQREQLYSFCVMLLDEALTSTQRSQLTNDSQVMHYLSLLRDTLAATQALVRHEHKLSRESEDFAGVLDQYVISQLRTANDLFSASEMNILDCIEDLLKFGEPAIKKDTEDRLNKLPKDDVRRYHLALREYSSYYRHFSGGKYQGDLPLQSVSW